MHKKDLIKPETLAENYIDSVGAIIKLLKEGKTEECLSELGTLEYSMQITLAMCERYDYEELLNLRLI